MTLKVKGIFIIFIFSFVISWLQADQLQLILLYPLRDAGMMKIIYATPHEVFYIYLKTALFGAFLVALPLVISQIHRVFPSGRRAEWPQKNLSPHLLSPVLFVLGAGVAYFALLPLLVSNLTQLVQHTSDIEIIPNINSFGDWGMMTILIFGMIAQLALVLTLILLESEQKTAS